MRRTPPPELVGIAAQFPGGAVSQIDGTQISDPDGYVPPEAIVGAWVVGPDGKLTGEFVENPRHGPVQDDFSKLTEPDHWLGWLSDEPAVLVRDAVAKSLEKQAPGAVVEWMKVTHAPAFLTGGVPRGEPDADGKSRVLVVRAAVAVPFALSVRTPDSRREVLWGAFSWVAVRLDRPHERRDRTWLDLWITPERAEELLRERVYTVGTAHEDESSPIG
ncbi:hypothetical protein QI554_34085 [Yinghuangia seranimata]|nr:hypothetical protein [Yinghuangia seranimata]